MNTQAQVHSLQAGESLVLPRGSAPAVLAEGELLVQEPAHWLAGMVVLPPAVRLHAPVPLTARMAANAVAVRASTIVVGQPVQQRPDSLATRLLAAVRSWRPAPARRPQGSLAH